MPTRSVASRPVIPVFDGHNDALTREDHARIAGGRKGGHVDIPRMREGGMRGGIFALFTPSDGDKEEPVERDDGVFELPLAAPVSQAAAAAYASSAAGRLLELERERELRVARSVADLDDAREGDGPPVAVMHLEGAEAIDSDLEALDFWHGAGLRSLGLVWSRPNAFAEGVAFRFPSSPDTGGGLTAAGRRLVAACNERGILVDVAHLNERGFWDVTGATSAPLVASHANAHALAPNSRNLTDAQLDEIARSDGLVGVTFHAGMVRADGRVDPTTPLEQLLRHLDYIVERIGIEHVGFGSDFDGAILLDGVPDVAALPHVVEELRARGYGEDEIAKLAHRNWLRVFAATWKT
jgi:membrane dipeptidase